MADRIKGITVEIGGDTTGLSKSLEGVNKKISGTKKDLREVERLLKLDPTNTELLEQKQRMLNDAVTDTSKKLEQLQAAEKRVQQQMAEGKASQEQYDALQREILLTEDQLKKAEDAARGFNIELEKIGGMGGKIQAVGDKISGMGTKMLPVTAAVAGLGTAAVKFASDFDENMNKVDVAFGDNADEVKAWSEIATKQFGLSQNAALEAASLFGDMGTSMGMSTEEAAAMATSLAGLAGDLSSFKNVDIQQAMTALNGVFTGETESLKRLGVVMTQTNLDEFASKTGRVYSEMSQAEKVALRYEYVMSQTTNAQGDYARTSDGTANSLRTMQASLDNLAVAFGQELLPMITPVINKITEMIMAFSELDDGTKRIITTVALLLAAVAPVMIILGKVVSSVGALMGLVPKLSGAFSALGKVMSFLAANPLGIALIAITAIITALATLYRKNEDFRNLVDSVWSSIKNTISKVAKAVSEFFTVKIPAAVNKAVEFVKSLPDKMLQIGSQIVEGLKNGIKNAWEGLKSFVKNKVNGLVDSVKKLLGIASPSKVFAEIGLWVMKGFAQGMNDGARYAEDTAQKITEAVEAKVEALNARLQEEGDKTAKAALQAQIQELESFKNEYTTALNELENKQQSMAEKLKGYGDLFTMTVAEEGNILEISDIQEDIDAIYAYSDALDDLKARGASKEFLDVVTGLNIDDATAYITQLLQRSDEDFNTYMDKWEEKQRLSEEIARKWYQGDLDAIHEEFINKIPDTLSELQDQLVVTGRRAADSIAQGILSGAFTVRNALASVLMGQDATGILTASPTMPRSAAAEVSTNSANAAVVSAPSSPTVVNVQFSGSLAQLGRVLQPVISTETMRRGASLIGG